MIKHKIYNTPNVGLVVIDGLRDLVKDINDQTEATDRIGDLLTWTAERNIHILTVLHMNKGNEMARGALGTELQNKAETVVSISTDPLDKTISVVKPEYCRDRDFEPFAFSVDETEFPYVREDWVSRQKTSVKKDTMQVNPNQASRIITPSSLSNEVHESILRNAFDGVEPGKYETTVHRIQGAAESLGYKFGENKAKGFVTFYQDQRWLTKEGTTYVLNLSGFESTDSTQQKTGLV
ncbi:hypothetical protein GCM10027299_52320 [Larkinella ripae]